jgi:hypothetical protein
VIFISLYTMMGGVLRAYDSSDIARAVGVGSVFAYVNIGGTYTDVTTNASTANTAYTGSFCAAASDAIFIGSTTPFKRIKFTKGAGGTYAGTAGALVVKYYNGASFSTISASDVSDGTLVAGNTLAADGTIRFPAPSDWAKGGGGSLSGTMYYIKLTTTLVPSPAPSADLIWPYDGQFYTFKFSDGNLSAPEGRARVDEKFVLDRGRGSVGVSAIAGVDDPILNPLTLSFSARLDSTFNKDDLVQVLQCGNPNYDANWSLTGTGTKTDTQYYDGSGTLTSFPAFEDSTKKTVSIQIIWSRGGVQYGREYCGVYFSPEQQSLAESADGVVMSISGLIYENISQIYWFGYRW